MTDQVGGSEISTIIDGRYRVIERIGSGGMADVLRCEDMQLGRDVALKMLHRRFAADEEFVERFRREASSAAGLQHPNVVAVYDRGSWDGTYYIAMEYLEGRTLKQIIAEEGPLDPARAVDIITQVLKAARFAHRHGIIHRDLKPHNVIVDAEGRAKVTDFGIAKAGASDMTRTGSIMGTAQYLSPEQAQGHAVTASSDLYSIGVILYEMLTGRVPFEGESAVTIALKQVNEAPVPPSHYNPAIPPGLEAVVLRALEKDPTRRFADADEFIAALQAPETLMAGPPTDATQVLPLTAPPAPLPTPEAIAEYRRQTGGDGAPPPELDETDGHGSGRWWLALLVGLVVAGLIVGGLLLFGQDKVRVPNVVGIPQAEAQLALKNRGFSTNAIPKESNAPEGQVIGQDPAPGSRVPKGSTIDLFISSGPGTVEIPDLIGRPRSEARRALRDLGLRIRERREPSETVGQNRVISTRPDVGAEVRKGSTVTLVISSGKPRVTVPDVTGESEDDARSKLEALGLTVEVTESESDSEEPGTVLSQTPAAGTRIAKGGTVTLTVAEEPPEVDVPDVLGRSRDLAQRILEREGFTVSVREVEVDDPSDIGRVIEQSPAGGRTRRGSTVTITVGRGPRQTGGVDPTATVPASGEVSRP
jgi:serine/threonine-protein kinase